MAMEPEDTPSTEEHSPMKHFPYHTIHQVNQYTIFRTLEQNRHKIVLMRLEYQLGKAIYFDNRSFVNGKCWTRYKRLAILYHR